MLRIPCPWCGVRDETEFRYRGDASRSRPAADAGVAAFHAYVYERANEFGWHVEWWLHVGGCRRLLKVVRHTREPRDPRGDRPAGRAARGAAMTAVRHASRAAVSPTRPARSVSASTGSRCSGLAGDTLASALLANGRRLVGRSFKYHRPRGILTAGADEPCALVDLIGAGGPRAQPARDHAAAHRGPRRREPEPLAVAALRRARDQRPAVALPARGLLLQDLHGAGVGLGAHLRAADPPRRGTRAARAGGAASTPTPAETVHDHTDVLVVGSGAAGLAAACTLGASGLRVLLADQDVILGAGPLLDGRLGGVARGTARCPGAPAGRAQPARHVRARRLRARRVRRPADPRGRRGAALRRTARAAAHRARAARAARHRRHRATDRLPRQRRARRHARRRRARLPAPLRRRGRAAARRCSPTTTRPTSRVFALAAAGIDCAGVIDPRTDSARPRAPARSASRCTPVPRSRRSPGGSGVRAVTIAPAGGGPRRALASRLPADLRRPHARERARQPAGRGARVAGRRRGASSRASPRAVGQVAGAARGVFGLAAAAADGERAARRARRRARRAG